MPANPLAVNELFYFGAIFEKFVRADFIWQARRTPMFLGRREGWQSFLGKLRKFVHKLFEVSKSLLYSELR